MTAAYIRACIAIVGLHRAVYAPVTAAHPAKFGCTISCRELQGDASASAAAWRTECAARTTASPAVYGTVYILRHAWARALPHSLPLSHKAHTLAQVLQALCPRVSASLRAAPTPSARCAKSRCSGVTGRRRRRRRRRAICLPAARVHTQAATSRSTQERSSGLDPKRPTSASHKAVRRRHFGKVQMAA
jgi:hypothetical protein